MAERTSLRILADDLTGALDSAAAFATPRCPIPVLWRPVRALPAVAAIDAGTREMDGASAIHRHDRLADWLLNGAPAFKKIDSLMRGNWAVELAALSMRTAGWRLVVAPAFPFQRRVTRAGRQWQMGSEQPLGGDIAAALHAAGLVNADIHVHDAQTDADLDAVVAREMAGSNRVLWVGTGGLAAALARARPASPRASESPNDAQMRAPFLALIGSHHPVMRAQIDHATAPDPRRHIRLSANPSDIDAVLERLAQGLSCIVTVAFEGARAAAAAAVIAERFSQLLTQCPPPGTLFVAGGETLRDVADAIGADSLAVEGAREPGLAVSHLRGGRFQNTHVLSKSGAFGGPDLLRTLFEEASERS